ncbi:hypothetical protein A3D85_03235 [Candidatus Amesbacteria bacterium RIFCSPHIGHO2_02_FULL_47_9]|uniref:Uncharacterized protein n=2 Tax=Microgenomates group TaxID=1794810 RepID=A0A0H4T9B8_9BACT|nr:hypothetical protein [uncultured Microgenomates bacterium Rifle_16ft_4_minimus_5815]OGC93021.1 MAG: hypothetical protein A2876_00530 [Candidatus Amesbacteria bacterium RIFCSPHIGHO2_01_FULL_48_32b]OGD05206.1 MAG: hypothetical protein A3D85_03235 [Candidatus Amesbacteria bacterium RIFCSPHIGHO2_02_FULL_47_9]OGD07494.1 MAG: hypothetical protein A2899_04300 [Candidatus Amesbacteria bacterium RIFCSPLOWO2_01_FULL_49_25]
MSKIEGPGFGCGAGSPVIPPEKWAVVRIPQGEVRLENLSLEQMQLWISRGDNYAVIGKLENGSLVLVYPSDLA